MEAGEHAVADGRGIAHDKAAADAALLLVIGVPIGEGALHTDRKAVLGMALFMGGERRNEHAGGRERAGNFKNLPHVDSLYDELHPACVGRSQMLDGAGIPRPFALPVYDLDRFGGMVAGPTGLP